MDDEDSHHFAMEADAEDDEKSASDAGALARQRGGQDGAGRRRHRA